MKRYRVTDGWFQCTVRADDARGAIDYAHAWDLAGLDYSTLTAIRIG